MTQLVPVQGWLPPALAAEVKAHCARNLMSVSELVRTLISQACEHGLEENRLERQLERIASDMNFAAVALDALLAGHPDPQLRSRAHEAFARKEERRRTPSGTDEGGK